MAGTLPKLARPFAKPTLQPGVPDGASRGQQQARMVGARRADYMLIDEKDLAWLRKDAEFLSLPLVRLAFADMPRGQLRCRVCSQQVSPQTMDELNQAVRQLAPAALGE